MPTAFDVRELEQRYAFLESCPPALLPEVVTLPFGTLPERVVAMAAWWEALLDGKLPPESGWPPPAIGEPVRRALRDLDIARFCKGQPELIEALMLDVLRAFRREESSFQSEILQEQRELERLERTRVEAEERDRAARERRQPAPIHFNEEFLRQLQRMAERKAAAARQQRRQEELYAAYAAHVRAWAEIEDVFGELGNLLGRGWDLAAGMLRQTGWKDLVRLRALIERLPQLRNVIRALGRLQHCPEGESVTDKVFVPIQRLEEELLEVRTPLSPTETRGVERTGEIARMLPAEAVMLGHPKLRMLWHAHRAERALLGYRVEGVYHERVFHEIDAMEEREQQRPRPERGPIIVVLDTSGSMAGTPETVAKALVLEALRCAHSEKRRCYVYAFSGPTQVAEHELDLSPEGVGRLLTFLGSSFHGGTDAVGVLARVLEKLRQEQWQRADVLLVSDGEWPAPESLVASVTQARTKDTRFHGVLIGGGGEQSMRRVCDPLHRFTEWAAVGGWESSHAPGMGLGHPE